MEHQVIVMEDISVEEKVGTKNGRKDSPATETPVAGANGWALHTASCPQDCYRFVSRYLPVTQVDAEPSRPAGAESSTPAGSRSAVDLLKAA